MSRRLTLGPVGFMIAVSACVSAKDYKLVDNGKPASRIVLAANAGPVERHAAAELAGYLDKVTGARVEIRPAPSKEQYNIFIGTAQSRNIPLSDAMRARLATIGPHGFLLGADDRGLCIIGRQPIGALYGAYHILKTCVGVRWFAPGADFEYCPKKPTVLVPGQITVSNPSFRFRYVGFVCMNVNSKVIDTWDWIVRNGMTLRTGKRWYNLFRDEMEKRGAEIYNGGHCFAYLLSDDLFDKHPEYFPLIDGRRMKQKAKGERAARRQPCTSNPKVAAIMAAALNKHLDAPPKGGTYLIGNNDCTHWCQCANCVKLDPPDENRKRFVGTRYYTFVNRIADRVYRTHPHADLWSWAYQNYQFPPTGVVPDKRLAISVCVHHRCYRHAMSDKTCLANAKFREMLAGWKKFGNPVVTREYNACFPGSPPYIPAEHVYCQDIKYYHKIGLSGFIIIFAPPDGTFGKRFNTRRIKESWYATWQMGYLAAQLAWDVGADYAALVEDMGSKYYGRAWPVMKPYRQELVRMYEETPGHICYGTPDYILGKCLERPGVEARLLALLDEAEKAVSDDPPRLCRVKRDREYFGMCWQTLHRDFLAKRHRELHATQRTGKLVIDGQLNEPDWKQADFTTGFVATDNKTKADPQTFVRVLYDPKHIYVGVEAMEVRPGEMRVRVDQRDGPVWSDSSVELFVAVPGMGGRYAQVVVNPRGVIYDALNMPSQQADTTFDSGMEVRTRVLDDRWVAEMRLPVSALGRRLQDGEVWKVNVGRNYRPPGGQRQSSSWSHGVFHGPDAYRSVVFGATGLLRNGDFEDAVEPNKYQKRTAWVFVGNRVPVRWAFHSGQPGTATLVTGDAASGKQCLRIKDGWIHQKINQAADYRDRLIVRCKARGKGILRVAMYRYNRSTGRHVSTVRLKEVKLGSKPWRAVGAAYVCEDGKVLRVAFHADGQIDIDDVVVIPEARLDAAPVP